MNLREIFDVFSRRPRPNYDKIRHSIPDTTRNRVFMWCFDTFGNRGGYAGAGNYSEEFWAAIHRTLQIRHGRPQLTAGATSPAEDAMTFLLNCDESEFVDFLEYIFRVDCFFHVAHPEGRAVAELNELLRVDNLPYHVTDFVKETVTEARPGPLPFGGRQATYINTL